MTTDTTARTHDRSLWLPGVAFASAGAAAAVLTASIAKAAGATLEIDGEAVPLTGFAVLAFGFSLLGVVIAAGLRRWTTSPRTVFVRITLVLLVLSLVPDVLMPDIETSTRVALVLAHLVTAFVVIPGVVSRLR
ncbi:MAG: hypothetical protein EON52_05835 [Actinomycetales bacterium]|nr:MAG: hypothetical protein EON52_05835 [Actinomycetales bacterium]